MDRRLSFPVFGNPPNNYAREFFDDQTRKLNQLVTLMRSPGEGRNTTIVLTNLQSNDYGLEPGSIFAVNGALRVSVPNIPYPAGLSVRGLVGGVSVTT